MNYNGFYDINHAQSYLRRSIIRIEDEPIFVSEIEERKNKVGQSTLKILYHTIIGNEMKTINLKSPKVNLAPVPLGLVNISLMPDSYDAVVVSRIPSRMWKIGLTTNNTQIVPVAGKKKTIISSKDLFFSVSFRSTIVGAFPNYFDTVKKLEDGEYANTIAFNRHFAMQKRKTGLYLIYYKFDVIVGKCSRAGPTLKQGFSFLKEHLDSVMR